MGRHSRRCDSSPPRRSSPELERVCKKLFYLLLLEYADFRRRDRSRSRSRCGRRTNRTCRQVNRGAATPSPDREPEREPMCITISSDEEDRQERHGKARGRTGGPHSDGYHRQSPPQAPFRAPRSRSPWPYRGSGPSRFADIAHLLPHWLAVGLQRMSIEDMKPIQEKVLPLALQRRDVIGIAPTGSGKTLAFLVPTLARIAERSRRTVDGPIAMVLAPTRELALQIGGVAEELMTPSREVFEGLRCAVLYGGASRRDQVHLLRSQGNTHLVVATPGRLLDLVHGGELSLASISCLVLDEGDRMLSDGFESDLETICKEIPATRQMLFFSATWPQEVESAAGRLCSSVGGDLAIVRCMGASGKYSGGSPMLPPKDIEQIVEVLDTARCADTGDSIRLKLPVLRAHLREAIQSSHDGKIMIFVETRRAAEELIDRLSEQFPSLSCGTIHGGKKQHAREAALARFRDGHCRVLVATDVVGRGLDIDRVSHVINFDFPSDLETYVHRVGRTGRNGQSGTAISFFELFEGAPWWHARLGVDLARVLRSCGQPVPPGLDTKWLDTSASSGW
mmetsp:Transcript_4430/g.12764  ORF Transcript_4430/g.12764 Transcript_4430/m.12764 type:complete len:566 (-) Transcript_4430:117-1814(-)